MVYCCCETTYNAVMKSMTDTLRRELGARIRDLRKQAGLTQEKLGEKADLNYKFIGELERGQVNVSLDSLVRIAVALEIRIEDLFSKEKGTAQKIVIKEKNPLSKVSAQDFHLIKKALRILQKAFSKV
jgi:transcriptional regulator with XRE-family HTH domain